MFVRNERARASEKGTEEQIERWGKKPLLQNLPMSAEIYNELDRQYNNRFQSYNGQTITPTMQDTLIKVCKWNVCIDFLVSNGEMQAAKQLTEMVEKIWHPNKCGKATKSRLKISDRMRGSPHSKKRLYG